MPTFELVCRISVGGGRLWRSFSLWCSYSGMVPCTLRDRRMSGHSPGTRHLMPDSSCRTWEVSPSSWYPGIRTTETPVPLNQNTLKSRTIQQKFSFWPHLLSCRIPEGWKVACSWSQWKVRLHYNHCTCRSACGNEGCGSRKKSNKSWIFAASNFPSDWISQPQQSGQQCWFLL
jgi:hypothetical protein